MKKTIKIVCAILVAVGAWCLLEFLSPKFFNSKIGRLNEKDLPKVFIENEKTIYCRMKADDFRFPLPPGLHALTPVLTEGGFDWVDGSVEVLFESSNHISVTEYERWLSNKIQTGASITATPTPKGLSIKFHYFGDK